MVIMKRVQQNRKFISFTEAILIEITLFEWLPLTPYTQYSQHTCKGQDKTLIALAVLHST